METEGGQREGGNGTELQGARKNMCDNPKKGDFRNERWGTVRDSGEGRFWEKGRKWGTGSMGETCTYCKAGLPWAGLLSGGDVG